MHLYDFVGYCSMLIDKRRLEAYINTLKRTITDESIVLDLGAGTGVFSILACDFGAKKVYSVEANHLITLLHDVIKEKGYESKIEVFQNLSTDIEFEEKANIMISDIHGAFPLFESSIETIIDARERLLTEDAILIPRKENIFFAISQAEEIYEDNVKQYFQDFHGFSIPSAQRLVYNRYFSAMSSSEILLSEPKVFAEINYRTINNTSFAAELEWVISKDGTAHGLRGWFENELLDNIVVSNSIEVENTTYSQPFFPFEREVKVKKNDLVKAQISANYEGGNYSWSWNTQIYEQGNIDKLIANFKQSELAAMYLDPKMLIKKSEYFIPEPNENAQVDLFILNLINGKTMQGDIADALLEKYPQRFGTFEVALEYAFTISQKYSK